MDDYLEENPIIIGLQIFIFVFLVIAFIALSWNYYNNTRIRAVYKATLPNHLEFLKNPKITIHDDEQVVDKGSTSIRRTTKIFNRTSYDDSKKKKNHLPPGLTPHSTKLSISANEEISRGSYSIYSQLKEEETQNKGENENTAKEFTQSKDIRNSELFRSVQAESEKLAQAEKEKSKKKKKEEDEKKKQLELEKQKEEKAADTPKQTGGKYKFNFQKNQS